MSGCPQCHGPLKFDAFGTWCQHCGRNPELHSIGPLFPNVSDELAETIMDKTETVIAAAQGYATTKKKPDKLTDVQVKKSFNCTIDGCPNPAVRLYYMPEGCYCKADTYQGLCEQHEETAAGNPMLFLMNLAEPLSCADCGLLYSSDKWCDCVLSDEVWKQIAAEPCVLCFNCMAGRLVKLRMDKVPVTIRSGPFLLAWDEPEQMARNEALQAQVKKLKAIAHKLDHELDRLGYNSPLTTDEIYLLAKKE